MPASYSGKTVLVTGASQGIGRALCLALSADRPKLVLAARDKVALEAVASSCRDKGAETLVQTVDVGRRVECEGLVQTAAERFGTVDVLVNNAGMSMRAPLSEVQDLEIFEELMRVNYLSCVYLTKAALPHLLRSRGQIVAVSSLAGLTGVPTRTGYAATKHAVIGFFDSLRIELQGTGCSVTVIAPDFVTTEIHKRSLGGDGAPLGPRHTPRGTFMSAERCAALVLEAMRARRRLAVLSLRGKIGRFVRLLAPSIIDRVAMRAVRDEA